MKVEANTTYLVFWTFPTVRYYKYTSNQGKSVKE